MKQSSLHIIITLLVVLTMPLLAAAQGHGIMPERPERQPGIQSNSVLDLLVKAMEKAHNAEAWQKHKAVHLVVKLQLEDQDAIDLEVRLATSGKQFIVVMDDALLFGRDDASRYHTPAMAKLDEVAVHVRALEHLLPGPFRLRDEEKLLAHGGMREVESRQHYSASAMFADRDDWLIFFTDPTTDQLRVLAYFISLKEDDDPAFSQAYAAVSQHVRDVDSLQITCKWAIWKWSRPRGLVGDKPIGTVTLSSVKFFEPDDETFARPAADDA